MKDTWNSTTYSQFLDQRTKPANDLLAAVPKHLNPSVIYDLGCGPGNSTALLQHQWENAKVIGLDSSQDMLQKAQKSHPSLTFVQQDIDQFSANEPTTLIFSNAALHWVNHHQSLLKQLAQQLESSGVLAIQIPNNFHAPSHQCIIETLEENTAWLPLLSKLIYTERSTPLYVTNVYYDDLSAAGLLALKIWETEYTQEMQSPMDIVNWLSGSSLGPILSSLNKTEQKGFLDSYHQKIKQHYPLQNNNKVLFTFRRLFMVGVKP